MVRYVVVDTTLKNLVYCGLERGCTVNRDGDGILPNSPLTGKPCDDYMDWDDVRSI